MDTFWGKYLFDASKTVFFDLARIILQTIDADADIKRIIRNRNKATLVRYFRKQLTVYIKFRPVYIIDRLMFSEKSRPVFIFFGFPE